LSFFEQIGKLLSEMIGQKFPFIYLVVFLLILLVGGMPGLALLRGSYDVRLMSNTSGMGLTAAGDSFYTECAEEILRSAIQVFRILRHTFFMFLVALFLWGLYKAAAFVFSLGFFWVKQFQNTSVIALFLGGRAPPCFV
jgi:hypothetical protein